MNLRYVGISTYQFIPCYAIALHKHTDTRILKLFEDSEPTGLEVETADAGYSQVLVELFCYVVSVSSVWKTWHDNDV